MKRFCLKLKRIMKSVSLKRTLLMGVVVSIFLLVSTQFQNEVIHVLRGSGDTGGNISVVNTLTSPWSWNSVKNVTMYGNASLQQSNTEKEKLVTNKPPSETIPWTVLMTVNNAFFDFYYNWLWHYQQLHLAATIVVIAEDDELYKKVELLNSQGVTLRKSHMKPINESLVFNTPLFKTYMSRRAVYIQEYLQKGSDVLHIDVDSVWLKNPFPYLVGDFDIWGQVDKPGDVICIGLVAFKSNDKVKSFVKSWIDAMQAKTNTKADQDVFKELHPERKLRLKKLPIDEFPSGKLYFEQFDNATRAKTVVVHNNWVVGHDTKKNRFIKFNLWKA